MNGGRRAAWIIGLVLATLAAGQAGGDPITVVATPIRSFDPSDASKTRFAALTFRGGLLLRSPDSHFGGWSGLRLSASELMRARCRHPSWLA